MKVKTFFLLAIILSCLTLTTSCGEDTANQAINPPVKPVTSSADKTQKAKLQKQINILIKNADKMAQQTQNPRAIEIVERLKRDAIPALPTSQGIDLLEPIKDKPNWVGILSLIRIKTTPHNGRV